MPRVDQGTVHRATVIAWLLTFSSYYFAQGLTWVPLAVALGLTTALVAQRAAFTGALRRLIQDPALRAELGARARARALLLDGLVMEQREAHLYRTLTPRKAAC